MRILQHGEAARSLLRFRPLAGSVQRIAARSELGTTLRDGGSRKPLPPTPGVQLILRTEVLRVDPEGVAHHRFDIEQVDLLVRDGTPLQLIEAMQTELEPLTGVVGEGRTAADGRALHLGFELPSSLSAPLRRPLEELATALGGLGTVLPGEPVGLGARWEVSGGETGPLTGAPLRFTLKALAPREVKVRIALGESGPALTERLRTRVRGGGGSELALDRLWPTRMELDVEAEARPLSEDASPTRGTDAFTTARLRIRELSFTQATTFGRVITG